jgi:hypothetical protein
LIKKQKLKEWQKHQRVFGKGNNMESLGDDYIQTPMEVETDSTGKHVWTLTMMFSKRSLGLCLHLLCWCIVLRWIRCLCDVTLSVYPHRAGLKNMPGHGGNRTYDLWNTSIYVIYTHSNITQASYSPEYITPAQQISWLLDNTDIEGTRLSSEISHTLTDLNA